MANYLTTDTELTAVADAIRTAGGTVADLEYPTEFISAISALSGGGSVPLEFLFEQDLGTISTTNTSETAVTEIDGTAYYTYRLLFIITNDQTSGFTASYSIYNWSAADSTISLSGILYGNNPIQSGRVKTGTYGGVYISDYNASTHKIVIKKKYYSAFGEINGRYTLRAYKFTF